MSQDEREAVERDFDRDPFADECSQCFGEGFYYDCFEEYACVDPEGGCHLCQRRCDFCNPRKPSAALTAKGRAMQ